MLFQPLYASPVSSSEFINVIIACHHLSLPNAAIFILQHNYVYMAHCIC